ncbi:hypothetical protein [Alicyclobacillus acidocaldarius]|uniref:hypothetical protein n=1 Tax=Alicyclobacillus acidocaldarius TaxID=405212 RepID=UPI00019DCC11|nr:hypothetical protein [Alicyclobacillus acidocaldarius]
MTFPEGEEAKPKKFGSIIRRDDNGKQKVCVNFVFEDGRIKEKMVFEPVPDTIENKLVEMLRETCSPLSQAGQRTDLSFKIRTRLRRHPDSKRRLVLEQRSGGASTLI